MARNNAPSGQLVGNWTRMRAMCSMTRAPILIRRSRIVANSAVASGLVFGMAARTPCINQNAAAGLDAGLEFADAVELDDDNARQIPKDMIGRLLNQADLRCLQRAVNSKKPSAPLVRRRTAQSDR